MRERENKDAYKKAEKTEKKLRFGRGGLFALIFLASIFVLPLNAFAAQSIYTDMFVMSYNQGASEAAQKIFSQMLGNMFFNAGPQADGGLEDLALGHCSEATTTDENYCYTDLDCERRNIGYCDSSKAKVTRDTKRLADLQDIQIVLQNYYTKLRCSNDFARGCRSNADCYGGGACGNFKPKLTSGTYVTGKTNSAWPSWQATLAKEVGVVLPVDPINKLFTTIAGAAATCSDPFDPKTCWDAAAKSMPMNPPENVDCNIDSKSSVYLYESPLNISSARMYIKGEISSGGEFWQPAWTSIPNLSYNPFLGYITEGICKTMKETCGDGDIQPGEDCTNCVFDAGCNPDQKCVKDAVNGWNCVAKTHCGNGDLESAYLEDCDLGPLTKEENGCMPFDCKFADGWHNDGTGLKPVCGDSKVKGTEQCDLGTAKNGAVGSGCTAQCMCDITNGYDCTDPYNPVKLCGNHILNTGETCDAGTSNGVPNSGCDITCHCVSGYNCTDDPLNPTKDCGDGVMAGSETCDDSNTDSGDGCSSSCALENGYEIDPSNPPHVMPKCGDGQLKGTEQCDFAGGVLISPMNCSNSALVPKCCNFPTDTNKCRFTDDWNNNQVCTLTGFTVNGSPSGSTITVTSGSNLTINWGLSGTSPTATLKDGASVISNASGSSNTHTISGVTADRTINLIACGVTYSVTVDVSTVITPVCELNILKATNSNTGVETVVSGATSVGTLSASPGNSVYFEWTVLNPTGSFAVKYTAPSAAPVVTTVTGSGNQTRNSLGLGNHTFTITPSSCGSAKTINVYVSDVPATDICGDGKKTGIEDCDCGKTTSYTGPTYPISNPYTCVLNSIRIPNSNTPPARSLLPWYSTNIGQSFCNGDCTGPVVSASRYCGDGIFDTGSEVCDCGDSVFSGTALGNPGTVSCSIGTTKYKNNNTPPISSLLPWSVAQTSYNFCMGNCQGLTSAFNPYCGDSIQQTSETCDTALNPCCKPGCTTGKYTNTTVPGSSPAVVCDASGNKVDCTGASWSCVYGGCISSDSCKKTGTATKVGGRDDVCYPLPAPTCAKLPCDKTNSSDGCCGTPETWANEPTCGLKLSESFALKKSGTMNKVQGYCKQACSTVGTHYLVAKYESGTNYDLALDESCSATLPSNGVFSISGFYSGSSPLHFGDQVIIDGTAGALTHWTATVGSGNKYTMNNNETRRFTVYSSTAMSDTGTVLVKNNDTVYLRSSAGFWLWYNTGNPCNTFDDANSATAFTISSN